MTAFAAWGDFLLACSVQMFLRPGLSGALQTFVLTLLAAPTYFCRSYAFAKVNLLSFLGGVGDVGAKSTREVKVDRTEVVRWSPPKR